MAKANREIRPLGSILPSMFFDLVGASKADRATLGSLVTLAVEEHLLWAAIRLSREENESGADMVRSDSGRSFITFDRFDSDLAPRDELVSRVGLASGLSLPAADLAATMIEFRIDTRILQGDSFLLPGVVIRAPEHLQGSRPDFLPFTLELLLDRLNSETYRIDRWWRRPRRKRQLHMLSLIFRTAPLFRVPLPYAIQLLGAADVTSFHTEGVPWTDVSIRRRVALTAGLYE